MSDRSHVCSVCNKPVRHNQNGIFCDSCLNCIHAKCANLTKCEVNKLGASIDAWYCSLCLSDMFVFGHLNDDDFAATIAGDNNISQIFQPFNTSETLLLDSEDIDPDTNFYNEYLLNDSKYMTVYDLSLNRSRQLENCTTGCKFSMLHVNARSLNKNFNSLLFLLNQLKLYIPAIAVSEIWTTHETENLFNIPGYNMVCKSREQGTGGGVALYIADDIEFCSRNDLCSSEIPESVFVELTKCDIILGCVYKPPNANVDCFVSSFDILLDKIGKQRKLCYLAGDFNIDILNSDVHAPTADFINCLFSHSYFPLINKPTRITSTSATIIDNIFTNAEASLTHDSTILYSDISDHLPIFINMTSGRGRIIRKDKYIRKRCFSQENKTKFAVSLQDCNWEEVLNSSTTTDANDMYDKFMYHYTNIYDRCFPEKLVSLKHKAVPRKPWMTYCLAKSCHTKYKLYRRFVKCPSECNKTKYVAYRNRLNILLRKAEQIYYREKFETHKNNLTIVWKTIKGIINSKQTPSFTDYIYINNERVTDKSLMAQKFNEYFTNIGPSLAKKISDINIDYMQYLKGNFKDTFCLFPTDPLEIISVASNLPNKTSYGHDNIPTDIGKLSVQCIASALCIIINSSFSTGIFPDALKIARVCPIYKSGDKATVSNYRPISVLPCFSKIFETLVYKRLENYLVRHEILCSNQYGFRKGRSTSLAILDMVDKISNAIDNKDYSIGVFVDLSKAFDTLNHKILLNKLAHYGIRGTTLTWFTSYLQNRLQYVNIDGYKSVMLPITCGVPQGSILGPILFLLYINDISSAVHSCYIILFADDTSMFMRDRNISSLIDRVNTELQALYQWLAVNKLSLNIDKTNFMIFAGKKNCSLRDVNIVINGKPIRRVNSTKFLGVYVDEYLNWNKQREVVVSKISKTCGILAKLKYLLPRSTLLLVYNSLLLPYLTYSALIWSNCSSNKLRKILVIQKKSIRHICFKSSRTHAAPLFKELELLQLPDICFLQICEFMFKFIYLFIYFTDSSAKLSNSCSKGYTTR